MKIKFQDAFSNVKGVFTDEKQIHSNIQYIKEVFSINNQTNLNTINIDSIYSTKHNEQKKNILTNNNNNYILFFALVSFHHKKGSVIETTFPSKEQILLNNQNLFNQLIPKSPSSSSSNEDKLSAILNQLTYICLPDGIHSINSDFEMTTITNYNIPLYCIFSYNQIKTNVNTSSSSSQTYVDSFQENIRDCIQKSLCVVSIEPLMFYFLEQIHTSMNNYMSQYNLDDKSILTELYTKIISQQHSQSLNKEFSLKHFRDFHELFSYKTLLQFLQTDIFTLIKYLLLEKKIIVYSHIPYKASHFMYNILSLFPLQLLFNLTEDDNTFELIRYHRASLHQYGFPFKLFHDMNIFNPIFTLHEIDLLIESKPKGYFIGTSNSLLLQNKSIERDLLINIDECSFELNYYNKDNDDDKLIKITNKEKEMYKEWIKMFEIKSKRKINDNVKWINYEMELDEIKSNGKMSNDIKEYFIEFLCDLSYGIIICLNENIDTYNESNTNNENQMNNNNNNTDNNKTNNTNTLQTLSQKLQSQSFAYFFNNISPLYSTYFIKQWIQTINSKLWFNSYDSLISYRSKYSSQINYCSIIYENGDTYLGGMKQGKKNGEGKLSTSNMKYSGEFVNDLFEGKGKLIVINESEYIGNFMKGKKIGLGTLKYENGDIYNGEFNNDLYNGTGCLKKENGDSYAGVFKDGKLNGSGVIVQHPIEGNEGVVFSGEFVNGLKHGKGKVMDKKGKVIEEGEWVNDVKKEEEKKEEKEKINIDDKEYNTNDSSKNETND